MLDALCDGSEDFVVAENKENEREFAQFAEEEDGKFYAEVAFVLSGNPKQTHLCSPFSLTLDEVNALLDQFESGEPMDKVCEGWKEWERNSEKGWEDVSEEWTGGSEVGSSSKLKIGGVILIILVLWVAYYVFL